LAYAKCDPSSGAKKSPQVVLLFFIFIIFIYGDNANIFLKYKFISRWNSKNYFENINLCLIEGDKNILNFDFLNLSLIEVIRFGLVSGSGCPPVVAIGDPNVGYDLIHDYL